MRIHHHLIAAAVVAGLTSLAAPAVAVPPTHEPYLGNGPISADLSGFCVDVIHVEGLAAEKQRTYVDQAGDVTRVAVSGHVQLVYSDPTTGRSFKANSSGPGTFYPDGRSVLRGGGGLFIDEAGQLFNSRGRQVFPDAVSPGPSVRTGTLKDVCAELGTAAAPAG